jgi:uncharacterized repeat protein (TIGR03803 family)
LLPAIETPSYSRVTLTRSRSAASGALRAALGVPGTIQQNVSFFELTAIAGGIVMSTQTKPEDLRTPESELPTSHSHFRNTARFSRKRVAAFGLTLAVASPVALAAGTARAQSFTVLHGFAGAPDGSVPTGGLIAGTDGNFYGTTSQGGANDFGTVYRISPAGALTIVHSMAGTEAAIPFGELALGRDGNFYGTTALGGTGVLNGNGVVYRVTPSGALTTLHVFGGPDGQSPQTGLLLGPDGNFYGTTGAGGATNNGTVFRITPSGTLTTLHSFTGNDGSLPLGALILGPDGNFYGTTVNGGTANGGTVYRISASGAFTSLHSFTFAAGDGNSPRGSLALGADDNFYGTTEFGGQFSHGTTYRITTAGATTILHSFTGFDGEAPLAGVTLASDGRFYGTTSNLGFNGSGTIYAMTAAGAVTIQHGLSAADGSSSEARLFQARNGAIYGTNSTEGPDDSLGTVFRLVPGPAFASPFVQVNTNFFTEDDVSLSTPAPITALTLTITVQVTPGLVFSGQFQNVGPQITESHVTTSSAITYTFTLNAGSTIPPGTDTFAAQMGTKGVMHDVHGDTFTLTYTSGGQTFNQSASY